MNKAILSAKGWVVIPQEIRARYRLNKGDRVHFIDYGGVVAIVPVSQKPLAEAAGMLKGGTSLTKALANSRREERDRGK